MVTLPTSETFGKYEPVDYHKGCTVVGWGKTELNGSTSDQLNEIYLPLIRNVECEKELYPIAYLLESQMCTVLYNRLVGGPCPGDTGGPLICDTIQVCNGLYSRNF